MKGILLDQQGLSFIELLVVLTIISVMITVAVPSLGQAMQKQRVEQALHHLQSLLSFTRGHAIVHQQAILCPTIDQKNCIGDWNQTLMVFIDKNDDRERNADEPLLKEFQPKPLLSLSWKGSGSSRYLRFKRDGSTGNQNGRLSYCTISGTEHRQLVIYRSGRIRKAPLTDAKNTCLDKESSE